MEEFLPIINYIKRYIDLTEEEQIYFVSLLRITRVKKKQAIVQPGFICQYRGYVVKGAMRSYLIDDGGNEHTVALSIEDWWISDFNSYIFQEPATQFVEALEDTVLIQITYQDEQKLLEHIPKFHKYFKITIERAAAAMIRRMLNNLSMTAEQRFEAFALKYPKTVERVPQYILASYLGFSTEFLSKIRNKKAKHTLDL